MGPNARHGPFARRATAAIGAEKRGRERRRECEREGGRDCSMRERERDGGTAAGEKGRGAACAQERERETVRHTQRL